MDIPILTAELLPPRQKENRTPLLDCLGVPSCGTWVPHTFKRREKSGGNKLLLIYTCDVCGAERIFGCEEQKKPTKPAKKGNGSK